MATATKNGPRVTTGERFADGGARASVQCGTCGEIEYQAALDMTVSGWVEGLGRLGWGDVAAFPEGQRGAHKTTHLGTCPACMKRLGAVKAESRKPKAETGATAQAASRKPQARAAQDSSLTTQDSAADAPPPDGLGASSEYQVRFVPIDQVVPTPDNPRFLPQDPAAFAELVASVKVDGVLVPMVGRPHPDPDRHHLIDLRAGSRRLAAARAAGLAEVPVIVRPMSDAQAAAVTVWENHGREDLHPLEEAQAIELLRKSGFADAVIAERMGHNTKWVARRHSLLRLSPKWVNAIRAGSNPIIRALGAGHFEAIARLPEDVQDQTLRQYFSASATAGEIPTVESLTADLAREAKDLSGVVWKLDDADLYPKAGACSACPKRTGANPVLFDLGPKGGDQCLDAACWDRKVALTVSAKRKALAEAHGGDVVLLGDAWHAKEAKTLPPKDLERVESKFGFQTVKAGTAGAKPAIEVSGPGAGRTLWVLPPSKGGGERGSRDGVKVDPREAVERRRRKAFVGLVNERLLSKSRLMQPGLHDQSDRVFWRAILALFDVGWHASEQFLMAWNKSNIDDGKLLKQINDRLLERSTHVAREHQAEPCDVKAAEVIAQLWGLDAKMLHAEVEAAHPLPGKKPKAESKKPKRGGLEAGQTSKRQNVKKSKSIAAGVVTVSRHPAN